MTSPKSRIVRIGPTTTLAPQPPLLTPAELVETRAQIRQVLAVYYADHSLVARWLYFNVNLAALWALWLVFVV